MKLISTLTIATPNIVLPLSLALLLSACGGDNDGAVRDLRKNLNQAQQEIADLETRLNELQNSRAPLKMTILHMNDHHSHIAPETFAYNVSGLDLAARTDTNAEVSSISVTYGGFPMLVSLFDRLAAQSVNPVKIHAGDAITGTLYYSLFNGAADAAMMNQVCFDAFALGNHEFDNGDLELANFLDDLKGSACNTAVLAANVKPGENSAIRDGYIQPYMIREVQGQKVGFIGIDIADKTKGSSKPDSDTQFLDEATTAQTYIDELRGQGVNKIVLVTHYQYENDKLLAPQLSGVDVIVGGDSHSLLGGESFKSLGFNPVGDYPTITKNRDGDTVCIVQAWEYGHLLGKLEVSFDADGKVIACNGMPYMPVADNFTYTHSAGDFRALSASDAFKVRQQITRLPEVVTVVPNATTENLLGIYNEEVSLLEQQIIGTTADNLCLVRFPGESRSTICNVSETSEHGSDISNIIAKAFMTVTPTADIAILNGGSVRVDVAAGDITYAAAINVLPFASTLVTLQMTGAQIKSVLEDALSSALRVGGSSGSYPYASGLRYHVNASAADGSRISNLEVNPRVSGEWVAINNTATYTVVTNDFIAAGQDGYATFGALYAAGHYVNTFTLYTQAFISYITELTAKGEVLTKLPTSEYSTRQYIGRDGCNHSLENCSGY